MSPSSEIIIHAGPLREFVEAILRSAGIPEGPATLVADALVAANLRAVDSHGVQLLGAYLEAIRNGVIDIHATGHLVSESGACAVFDGQHGLGYVVAAQASDIAVRLARTHGIGFVSVRDSNHFGAAAYWGQRIARAGMLALVVCDATPLVAPWQGREARLGTNPLCVTLPGDNVWQLDMATTTVALNRIFKAAANGETEIPAGWAVDKDGVPTTSTKAALEGFPTPLGGYKGTGLSMMVEVLCAVLSGGAMGLELGGLRVRDRPMRTNHAFLALDVSRLMPLRDFTERMHRLRDMIKDTAPATGYDEVLMAGEPEWRAEADRTQNGIPITTPIWNKLLEIAAKLGVTAYSH